MRELIRTILIMSVSGSIVAAILFVLNPFVRNRLPKSAQYYLWLVVIAALLVPVSKLVVITENSNVPIPVAPIQAVIEQSVFSVTENGANTLTPSPSDHGFPEDGSASGATQPRVNVSMATVPTILYPLGVAAALLYFLISYTVFTGLHRRRNRAASTEETAMLAELCGSKRIPQLYRNPLAATPMLFGLIRPAIILPDRDYTEQQLRAVLLHELNHLRHKDILVKWLSVFACAAHWFNPIVWLVRREVDRACELSCDEAVIRDLDTAGKQSYGETLLYVASESKIPHAVLSTTMCEEKKALKQRLSAILKSKKHSSIAIIVSVLLILAVSSVAVALGAGRSSVPLFEMQIVYVENPAHFFRDMTLIWNDTTYYVVPMVNAQRGREIGFATDERSTWRIYEIRGRGSDYLLAVESEDVWRVMSIYPGEQPERQYILENATDRQRFERMLSVSLYSNGTVRLSTPPISSYMLVGTFMYEYEYNVSGDVLWIHDSKGDRVARFDIVDENTIIFRSASIPLHADEGARYVLLTASPVIPPTPFSPRVWLDYYYDDNMPWDSTIELMLDEFPGVTFSWSPYNVTAHENGSAKVIISGMPVWNVFLADLNGDGFPEFCATVSFGSGLIDSRVIVYDYIADEIYELQDRGYYDYRLSLQNGWLIVTQTGYADNSVLSAGEMAIIDGQLVVLSIGGSLPDANS